MAAAPTLQQHSLQGNFVPLKPQYGVVTLWGYGVFLRVDRGHLIVEDGVGTQRRLGRFAKIGHGLKRVVIIGAHGTVSLAALRWLADQNAAFVMLERNGKVLAATGPTRSADARLRRSQSLAHQSGAALEIARDLISQKLEGQGKVARDLLKAVAAAEKIESFRAALGATHSIDAVRQIESQAAQVYWALWRELQIRFPAADYPRVPGHWRTFGTRKSVLTGSQRLAINPANAMLNYLYALLEVESRIAAAAMGLDPGIGVLHVDTDVRDSLACDLMEAVRPLVDTYLLKLLTEAHFRREWFFEQRNGSCRIMASFAATLSETMSVWRRAIEPVAEACFRRLWARVRRPTERVLPATRLTQERRRAAKGNSVAPSPKPPKPGPICGICGKSIGDGSKYCAPCFAMLSTERFKSGLQGSRELAHSPEAQMRRAETLRRHHASRVAWDPSTLPVWLDEKAFQKWVQPQLAGITVRALAEALGVTVPYASSIRSGQRQPHPRHWASLWRLVGLTTDPLSEACEKLDRSTLERL